MFNLPRFQRRRDKLTPIQFVTVEKAFRPQIKVVATRDLNGWVDQERKVKFHIGKGRVGMIDKDKAREWETKGYVKIISGKVAPVSEMEAEEFLSQMTTINLGG